MAARITERSDRSVLLLEAGPDYTPAALPADLADGTRNSMFDHDWGLRYTPSAEQIEVRMPRGKVMGGSSAVNTCIALRGEPEDYDEWAARGLSEWGWEGVRPYFRKLERDLDHGDSEHHSSSGPLPIRRHTESELPPWQAGFLQAAQEAGWPRCSDHNAPGAFGVGPYPMNKIDGRRISTAEAWLTPDVRARDNLTIQADTLVTRVLFSGRKVRGVEVERADGTVETIAANQVVLSGGAIQTPALLMRSGIGPRSELDRLGVTAVHNLQAVGARLLDHPGFGLFCMPMPAAKVSTSHPIIQVGLRFSSSDAAVPNDLQIQAGSFFPWPAQELPLVWVMGHLGKPVGHGFMRVNSANPHSKPTVRSFFLEHPTDRRRAAEAIQAAGEIIDVPLMRRLARPIFPRRSILRERCRIERWIRKASGSGYHPSGTVPMGEEGLSDAACDGHGRVFGVEGLRVADASLYPTIMTANTNLPTIMIGEKIGEWLQTELD